MNIIIPSKGRAGNAKAIEKFLSQGYEDFIIVVEPQEHDAYLKAYPDARICVLPKDNQGIAYVRNFCLQMARASEWSYFWMLDDDINSLNAVVDGKTIKSDSWAATLQFAQGHLSQIPDLSVGALEYQQFAWAAKKSYAMNSYCDTCVMVNVKNTEHMHYRDGLKEDRDFCLQALSTGYQTARTTLFSFGSPKNGSNKGGLYDQYKAGLEMNWSEKMIEMWPGICALNIKKDGRPDVKINWKFFKK